MIHPMNMDKTYFVITTTSGDQRRVSNKEYVMLPSTTWPFKSYIGERVRLVSLRHDLMPGDLTNDMACVALSRALSHPSGFNERGDVTTPGAMGVHFADLAPL